MIIQEMQDYYGKRASGYDASMGYDDEQKVRSLRPVIDELQAGLKDRRVLELACGPCFWTQFVAEVAQSVVATDFNQSTLDEAVKKGLPKDRVSLFRADAYQLDAVPGAFDAVFAVDWWAHVPLAQMAAFMQGVIARVPSGSPIVFVDQLAGPHSLTGVFDAEGNHIQERSLADGSTYRVIKHFFTDAQIADLFSDFSGELVVRRFPDARRVLVKFTTG